MLISGLEKLSLVDFNEKTACTVFLAGCNFRCPFCHNVSLVYPDRDGKNISEDEFFAFLRKRQGLLDGVCISGGEPLLRPLDELRRFISEIRALGYLIKLDTNGSRPDALIALVNEGLIDYVAMDIKNSPQKYAITAGLEEVDIDAIKRSVDFLIGGSIGYEFRTTVTRELHTEEDFHAMGEFISGAERFFIQKFNGRHGTLEEGLSEIPEAEAEELAEIMRAYAKEVKLRGY